MENKKHLNTIYLITLVVAGCSILYELVIAHTISLLAANTVVWYSVTIGLFLGSLGVGSIIYKRFVRNQQYWRAFFWVQLALSTVGMLASVMIHFGHIWYSNNLALATENLPSTAPFFAIAILMIIAVGMLTGMELPLLFDIGNTESVGRRVTNRVLAIDYIGSLVGALLFPLVLVTNFEVITIGFMTASANCVVAVLTLVFFIKKKEDTAYTARAIGATVLSIVLVLGFVNIKDINAYFVQHYYYYYEAAVQDGSPFASVEDVPDVERYTSPYQKIDIVSETQPSYDTFLIDAYSDKYIEDDNYPIGYFMYLNGDWQLFTTLDEIYHEYFAHVAVAMEGSVPQNVLVLGGGDGILISELLEYKEVESITQLDLDPTLINLAKEHPVLSYINRGALEDPRVTTVFDDGLKYMRENTTQYDAIYIDFPYAVDYNLAKLYSTEFYSFVRNALSEDGYAVFDAVGIANFTYPDANGEQFYAGESEWDYYYPTLRHAGFETIIPYVANLEYDNEKAVKLLDELDFFTEESGAEPLLELEEVEEEIDDADEQELFVEKVEPTTDTAHEAELAAIEQAVTDFVWGSQQGFIILKKGAQDAHAVDIAWHEPPIDLHLLNEERFLRAFTLPFPFPEEYDVNKVNSITRPTLPTLPFWFVRTPY